MHPTLSCISGKIEDVFWLFDNRLKLFLCSVVLVAKWQICFFDEGLG